MRSELPEHSLPSDYSDVQPHSYDPDYISQISSKMQVPHRIGIGSDHNYNTNSNYNSAPPGGPHQYASMSIPDKIIVAGENQHIGSRHDFRLGPEAPSTHVSSESMAYVGLMTPPRTLTLEERFPYVEDTEEKVNRGMSDSAVNSARKPSLNGQLGGPLPYEPGVSLHDPVLLNEEDEATLLRTQMAKLTRRVQVIEEESQKRAHRELVMYPLILGYFLWKILGWFTRDR